VSKTQDGPRWARNRALAEYLGVTEMSIWRWQRDPALNFPQPSVINNIGYTDLSAVDAWMRERVIDRTKKADRAKTKVA
jgi:predicted DNA-binding transcriptional regulator AlpA